MIVTFDLHLFSLQVSWRTMNTRQVWWCRWFGRHVASGYLGQLIRPSNACQVIQSRTQDEGQSTVLWTHLCFLSSVILEDFVYTVTVSGQKVFVVKRQNNQHEAISVWWRWWRSIWVPTSCKINHFETKTCLSWSLYLFKGILINPLFPSLTWRHLNQISWSDKN